MRRIIAAINMTLDGYCDHTAVNPDEEIHEHYTKLLENSGLLLYGRITYQLMEAAWPAIVKNPTGNKAMDDFAVAIDNLPIIVFSRTLKSVTWKNSTLRNEVNIAEILALKQQPGKDILVGSPGMIITLLNLGLVDEFQFCVHPVIVGGGLPLFKNVTDRTELKLRTTKTFGSGAIILYYEPAKNLNG